MNPTPVQLLTQTAGAALARPDLIAAEQAAAAINGVMALESAERQIIPSKHRAFVGRTYQSPIRATIPRDFPYDTKTDRIP